MQFGASSQIYTCICVCVPNALSRTRFIHVLHVVQIRRTEGWCERAGVKLCGCPLGGGLNTTFQRSLFTTVWKTRV